MHYVSTCLLLNIMQLSFSLPINISSNIWNENVKKIVFSNGWDNFYNSGSKAILILIRFFCHIKLQFVFSKQKKNVNSVIRRNSENVIFCGVNMLRIWSVFFTPKFARSFFPDFFSKTERKLFKRNKGLIDACHTWHKSWMSLSKS